MEEEIKIEEVVKPPKKRKYKKRSKTVTPAKKTVEKVVEKVEEIIVVNTKASKIEQTFTPIVVDEVIKVDVNGNATDGKPIVVPKAPECWRVKRRRKRNLGF